MTVERVAAFQPQVIGIGSFTVTFGNHGSFGRCPACSASRCANGAGQLSRDTCTTRRLVAFLLMSGCWEEGEFTMLELVDYFSTHERTDLGEIDAVDGICYRLPIEQVQQRDSNVRSLTARQALTQEEIDSDGVCKNQAAKENSKAG